MKTYSLINSLMFTYLNKNKVIYKFIGRENYIKYRRANIIKISKNNESMIELPEVIEIAKASAILSLTNSGYTFYNNIHDVYNDYDYKNNDKICNPSYYSLKYIPKGDTWSYSTFIHKIKEELIAGVTLNYDGTSIIVIDKHYLNNDIISHNLHHVYGSPLYLEKLIDLMVKYNIQFDFTL